MPPDDAPTGALTVHEKEVTQAWIAAGAPSAPSSPDQGIRTDPQAAPEEVAVEPTGPPVSNRLLRRIGKFHLLTLHFPIALLIAAAVAECGSLVRGGRIPTPTVRYLVLLGATSAVCAAALGWLHALSGFRAGTPRLLTLHRWLGTTAGVWAVITAIYSEHDAHRGVRTLTTRVLLLVGALLVGLTGHFGGILTHGADFFDG
jgi:uncharacterized membrane protein